MSEIGIGILLLLLLLICFILCAFFFLFRRKKEDSFTKGRRGEAYVVGELNQWAAKNKIKAQARLYPMRGSAVQEIDVEFNYPAARNVGIEVKFRNIDRTISLASTHISRIHKDGNRQCSKQLHGYIKRTGRLGLYAFVFSANGVQELYFIPHYVLEPMIEDVDSRVGVTYLKNHPHTYRWVGRNLHFKEYILKEYQGQQKYFARRSKRRFSLFGWLKRKSDH